MPETEAPGDAAHVPEPAASRALPGSGAASGPALSLLGTSPSTHVVASPSHQSRRAGRGGVKPGVSSSLLGCCGRLFHIGRVGDIAGITGELVQLPEKAGVSLLDWRSAGSVAEVLGLSLSFRFLTDTVLNFYLEYIVFL